MRLGVKVGEFVSVPAGVAVIVGELLKVGVGVDVRVQV